MQLLRLLIDFFRRDNQLKFAEETEYILNVPGKYWVDQSKCLAHACCVHEAPNNFVDDQQFGATARIYKQPETPDEERQCQEAMKCCPMAAIRDDGETNPKARKFMSS